MAATISPLWRTRDALAHSDITALCFVRLAQPAIPGSRPARQNLSPASRVQNIIFFANTGRLCLSYQRNENSDILIVSRILDGGL